MTRNPNEGRSRHSAEVACDHDAFGLSEAVVALLCADKLDQSAEKLETTGSISGAD